MTDAILMLGADMKDAYETLSYRLTSAFHAGETTRQTSEALTAEKQKILLDFAADPKALGANEAARTAKIADMTAGLAVTLAAVEKEERQARHELDLARLRVDHLRAQLRVAEVAAGLSRHEG